MTTQTSQLLGAHPEVVAACAEHYTSLDVGTTRMGDSNFAALLQAQSTATLTSLKANGCSLSDRSISALSDSALTRLTALDLSSNKLTNAALATLANWPGLENVTHLKLGNNRKLSRVGYAALADSPHLDPAALLSAR